MSFEEMTYNNPERYQSYSWEAIELISELTADKGGYEGFLLGNVIKYIYRYPLKGKADDLEKAIYYLTKLKEHIE